MEDGLLISDHLAIPYCQSIIASLQVKVLKGQLDYLNNSKDKRHVTHEGNINVS